MRFRVLFAVFNVVILLSFVLIFLMPAIVLGWDYTSVFWSTNWPLGAAFLVVLIALNAYFVGNWRVFSLLEQEDWDGIVRYLEPLAFEHNRINAQRGRILVNAYIASRSIERIGPLAAHLSSAKPRVADALVLELGVPRLLGDEGKSMLEELTRRVESPRVSHPEWVRWCYAVCLLLNDRIEEAKDELVVVATEARDNLLAVLAGSMLDPYAQSNPDVRKVADSVRNRIRSKISRDKMIRLLERERQRLHIVILGSQIEQAIDWAYPGAPDSSATETVD